MCNMFKECSSLSSLDLSNFDTSNVEYIQNMFYDCTNLEYINLKIYHEISINSNSNYYKDMLKNVPENVVICLSQNNDINIINTQLNNKKCKNIVYSDNWECFARCQTKQKKRGKPGCSAPLAPAKPTWCAGSHSARDFLFSLPVRLKGRAAVQGLGRKAGIYGNWRVPGAWTG